MIEFNLTHTRLFVKDFKSSLDFYANVLGMSLTLGDENWGYADFYLSCGAYLGLVDQKHLGQAAGDQTPPANQNDRLCLVFSVASLPEALAHLESYGIAIEHPPRERWGSLVTHFRDPDGNLLEMAAPILE